MVLSNYYHKVGQLQLDIGGGGVLSLITVLFLNTLKH